MKLVMSDKFIDQSLVDKARWFATLTMEERMAWLDEWTEIILQNNPEVFKKFNDDSTFKGTVCVLIDEIFKRDRKENSRPTLALPKREGTVPSLLGRARVGQCISFK